jgi:hypothetical protein
MGNSSRNDEYPQHPLLWLPEDLHQSNNVGNETAEVGVKPTHAETKQ